jgi:hypothetical protein
MKLLRHILINATKNYALNNLNWLRNENWTSHATTRNVDGTGFPNGQGFGAFRILPYRVITFQWKFDTRPFPQSADSGDAALTSSDHIFNGKYGCWFEMSREVLVPRKHLRILAYSG